MQSILTSSTLFTRNFFPKIINNSGQIATNQLDKLFYERSD